MREPRWLTTADARSVHDRALRAFGGLPGIRDPHLVGASVSRPRFKFRYQDADLPACAAAYAFAFARNHPFHDGNKRTAFGSLVVFLALNGWRLEAETEDCVQVILGLATGRVDEAQMAAWVRKRAVPE